MSLQRDRFRIRSEQAKDVLGRKCAHCDSTDRVEWEVKGPRKKTATGKPLATWLSERAAIQEIIKTGASDRLGLRCYKCRVGHSATEGKKKNQWKFLLINQPVFLEDHSWDEWLDFIRGMKVPEDNVAYVRPPSRRG